MKSIYFVGAGGIGMSALERYFNANGYKVGGYDKTPSPLTDALISEGIDISKTISMPSILLSRILPRASFAILPPSLRTMANSVGSSRTASR